MSNVGRTRPVRAILRILEKRDAKIHFIGLLGAGMLPLAELLAERGYTVSGSDAREPQRPLAADITLVQRVSADSLGEVDLVVYSLAIPDTSPELSLARELSIPTFRRAELLGAIASLFPTSVGVAGTHGKSSVTAMLATALAPLSPTVICGAELGRGSGLLRGGDGVLVYEACEYKDSFLSTRPTVSLLLNLELDHTDYFPDLAALSSSFSRFAASSDLTVYNADDPELERIARERCLSAVSFGVTPMADYRYEIVGFSDGVRFALYKHGEKICELRTHLLGAFNVTNCVAAAVTALELGVEADKVATAIASYRGIPRRLEAVGRVRGADVIYDYAHHPSEIRAGIDALRGAGYSRIAVVFCPHTYTRTRSLWDGFVSSLSLADRVVLTDVFAAREEAIEGISAERLADAIGERCAYADSPRRAVDILLSERYDAVVVMGAGDLDEVKRQLLTNS